MPALHPSVNAREPALASVALVIEDDAAVRMTLCEALEMSGYAVRAASGGADALRLVDEGERPALILMDLLLLGMDGWTLLGALRARGVAADVPVVVTSAAAVDALEATAREGCAATPAGSFDEAVMLRLLDGLRRSSLLQHGPRPWPWPRPRPWEDRR